MFWEILGFAKLNFKKEKGRLNLFLRIRNMFFEVANGNQLMVQGFNCSKKYLNNQLFLFLNQTNPYQNISPDLFIT